MQVGVGVQTVPEKVWPRGADNAKPASGWSASLAPQQDWERRLLTKKYRGCVKVSESESVKIPILDNFDSILKVSESECVRIRMCQKQKVSEPESVRIVGNLKVSEYKGARIFQNVKVSESKCVRISYN